MALASRLPCTVWGLAVGQVLVAPADGAKSIEFRVDGHEVNRNLALEDKKFLLPRQP